MGAVCPGAGEHAPGLMTCIFTEPKPQCRQARQLRRREGNMTSQQADMEKCTFDWCGVHADTCARSLRKRNPKVKGRLDLPIELEAI